MRQTTTAPRPAAKPAVKTGVSKVPTKEEVALAEMRTALERQTTELQAKLAELTVAQERLIEAEQLSAEKVMKENAALSAREKKIADREALLAQREAAVNQKEQQQSERDQAFQTEYAERIAGLNRAVEDFNERVKELDLRVAELIHAQAEVTARDAQLTSRESQLTVRSGATTARRRHLPAMPSAAPTPREETAERVKSWYEMHYPVVSDSRPTAWIYSEKTKKEMNTGEAKIAYLKKVIREIPEDVSEDHLQSMIGKIQENRELSQDALFALKIELIHRVNHYIRYPSTQDRTKSVFSRFFSAEIVNAAEEVNRAKQMRACLLHLENENDLTALEAIRSILTEAEKLTDSKKWTFSETFAACLQECREKVVSYQSVEVLSNTNDFGF